jgi:integrase
VKQWLISSVACAPCKPNGRTVSLHPDTVEVLRAWANAQREDKMHWRRSGWQGGHPPGTKGRTKGHGPVFTNEDGSPVHADHVATRFERLVRDAGVKRIRFHDVRHTHISLLLAEGEPVLDVAARVGHASATMTLNMYGHVIEGREAGTAAAFAKAIAGGS